MVAIAVILSACAWPAAAGEVPAPPDYRAPGYWAFPAVFGGYPMREVVHLTPDEESRSAGLYSWLASTGAQPMEVEDGTRPVWLVERNRAEAIRREMTRFKLRPRTTVIGKGCPEKAAAQARSRLRELEAETAFIENYPTRLESTLFFVASYSAGLAEAVRSCDMGSQALLVLDVEGGSRGEGAELPSEMLFLSPRNALPDDQIRVPPDSEQAPENYLDWVAVDALHLCSGKATVLAVAGLVGSWRTQVADILRRAGAQELRVNCAEPSTIVAPDDPIIGYVVPGHIEGYRVPGETIAAIKTQLGELGKVTAREALVEAVYDPGREQAHRWYGALRAELKEAGELLRDTPHVDALLRDELGRLPRYFASSDDPEQRQLLYILVAD